MNFFKNLLEPVTNETEVANVIVGLIKAKISKTTLKKAIEEHPDYPSLLSISDAFTFNGVENIALKIGEDKLPETSNPFLIQLNGNKKDAFSFSVVKEIRNSLVNYYDPEKHKWAKLSKADFVKKNTGIVLLVGQADKICEKDYDKKIKTEKRKSIIRYSSYFYIPILSLTLGILFCFQNGTSIILPFIYLFLILIGCGLGMLLLWYEIDKHNPVFNQICKAGKKINCESILSSNASRVAGLSWSNIGFSYFTALLLLLIFGGLDNKVILYVLFWASVFAIPYVIFSIYYQWIIAKQWCVLCLSVACVLVLQTSISIFAGWYAISNINSITLIPFIQALIAFIFPLSIINVMIPTLHKAKEGKENFTRLQKLKNDPNVFTSLLKKQKKITESPDNLGIILGNSKAKTKIIKVCNPYCGPCANAHKTIEDLLMNNENLQVQILFTANNIKNDIRTPPVKHFLALAEKYDEENLKRALDDWYFNDTKHYEAFAAKHPLKEGLEEQDKKIDMMKNWCEKEQIEFTPTFFISISEGNDGKSSSFFQMPTTYTVNDLKYLLK